MRRFGRGKAIWWSGAQPRIFLILCISTTGKSVSSNQNDHVFVRVGQGKLGTRKAGDKERGGKVKIQLRILFPNIFSIYKNGTEAKRGDATRLHAHRTFYLPSLIYNRSPTSNRAG